MAVLDLFGRRWSLRIIWELHQGPTGFRPLQQRCDRVSSSVQRQRLLELAQVGLVARQNDSGYTLTAVARTPTAPWARSPAHPLTREVVRHP